MGSCVMFMTKLRSNGAGEAANVTTTNFVPEEAAERMTQSCD